jgi:hypothetical protein
VNRRLFGSACLLNSESSCRPPVGYQLSSLCRCDCLSSGCVADCEAEPGELGNIYIGSFYHSVGHVME